MFLTIKKWVKNIQTMHCNPLQGNYRVELLYREIPVIITFFCFGYISFTVLKHWNCCSSSCNVYRELPSHTTGFEGLLWYPVIFAESLQGRITTQEDPCSHYREWICSECLDMFLIIRRSGMLKGNQMALTWIFFGVSLSLLYFVRNIYQKFLSPRYWIILQCL